MKKINKKLSLSSESVRILSAMQLEDVAGGAPTSNLGSGCVGCGTETVAATCYSCFPCNTQYGATCPTVCR